MKDNGGGKKAVRGAHAELPTLAFATATAWAAWLRTNHKTGGLWLKFAKRASGTPSVTYAEAVEAALSYGWIDGQAKGVDDATWLQKFTPRGPKSIWSKINRGRAEALISSGRMRAAGLKAVQAAKADGRWAAAYDSPRTATVPDDFQAALDASPKAKDFFATLNRANRYAILIRIQMAKKAETRARRIETFVLKLERHEKLYP